MIDTIKKEELEIKQEDLLKNMKMIRNSAVNILDSKFLKGLAPEPHNGVITVYGEQFPVYISANIISAKGLPEITDDILVKENYLTLLTNDDIRWYALVEYLGHQADLLQEDNIKYSDDLVNANEEIDNLNLKLAEEIKVRQGYEEAMNQLREENHILREKYDKLKRSINSAYGDHDDMTITEEAMAELTLKNKDLETEIEKLKHENDDFASVAEAHLETTAKFAEYKDRQKRLYKHFKNLVEMIEDLMELG